MFISRCWEDLLPSAHKCSWSFWQIYLYSSDYDDEPLDGADYKWTQSDWTQTHKQQSWTNINTLHSLSFIYRLKMKGLSQIRVCPPLASVSFMSHFKEQSFIHPLFMIIKHKHMQHIFHITQKSFRHHTHTHTWCFTAISWLTVELHCIIIMVNYDFCASKT